MRLALDLTMCCSHAEADMLYPVAPEEAAAGQPAAEQLPHAGAPEEVQEQAGLPAAAAAAVVGAGGPAPGASTQEAGPEDTAAAAIAELKEAAMASEGRASEAASSLVAQAKGIARQSFLQHPPLQPLPPYPIEEGPEQAAGASNDTVVAASDATAAELQASAEPADVSDSLQAQSASSAASLVKSVTTAVLAGGDWTQAGLPDLAALTGGGNAAAGGAAAAAEGTPRLPDAAAIVEQLESSGAVAAAGAPSGGGWGALAPAPAPAAPDVCATALGIPKVRTSSTLPARTCPLCQSS